MTGDFDRAYYLKREARERELAASATDAGIAKIHLDMATNYAELATEDSKPKLRFVTPK